MEWNRNGKGMQKERKKIIQIDWSQNLLEWNVIKMEMERNLSQQKNSMQKRNGNGMEIEW